MSRKTKGAAYYFYATQNFFKKPNEVMVDKNRKKNQSAKKFHILFFPLMTGLIDDPSYITEPLIKDVTEANTDGGSAK